MNGAHLHLIVTHLPVLGVVFGAVLLGVGLFYQNRTAQQVALSVLVLAGLAAGAAYLTGEGAEEVIESTLGAGKPFLERHEETAVSGLVAAGIAGAPALNLVIAFGATGTLAWVANLGGQIGHPEIRSGQSAPTGEEHEREESR